MLYKRWTSCFTPHSIYFLHFEPSGGESLTLRILWVVITFRVVEVTNKSGTHLTISQGVAGLYSCLIVGLHCQFLIGGVIDPLLC